MDFVWRGAGEVESVEGVFTCLWWGSGVIGVCVSMVFRFMD